MKKILLLALTFLSVFAQAEDTYLDKLKFTLEALKQEKEIENKLNHTLLGKAKNYAQGYTTANPYTADFWITPSTELIQKYNEVADAIETYQELILSMAYDNESFSVDNTSLILLQYARPSQKLKQALLNHIKTPRNLPNGKEDYNKGTEANAYRTLFELGLEDEQIVSELVEVLINSDTKNIPGLLKYLSTYKIKEFIPYYLKEVKILSEEKNYDKKRRYLIHLLKQIAGYGDDALELVPYFEKELATLDGTSDSNGNIFDRSIYDYILNNIKNNNKKLRVPYGYGVLVDAEKRGVLIDGKLNPNLLADNTPQETTQPQQTTQQTKPQEEQTAATTTASEKQTSSWLIYVLAALGLVVLLLVIKKFKNKN